MKHQFTLIIPAAGEGRRLGAGTSKAFVDLGGSSMLVRTMERFDGVSGIADRVVAVRPCDVESARSCLDRWDVAVVEGGSRRQDSVRAGLYAAKSEYVAIHDAARPFVPRNLIERVLHEAVEHGAAIAAAPVTDTIKQAEGDSILRTVPRDGLWAAQTPQAFETEILRRAFESAGGSLDVTDDSQLVEALGIPVRIVPAGPENLKITTPEDLERARALLA
jgi:2-C-methyl-D-erythritol 4-phosphate cytidylyltransferase